MKYLVLRYDKGLAHRSAYYGYIALNRSASTPELLAPAGDWDCLRAAAANGADAVYFGLPNYSARYRATNFTAEELPEVMAFLHDRNVRGYVAFNTLIFSDELPDAVQAISQAVAAGIDAIIVQDLGLARLIRHLAPDLPIHGSTQMTLTEARGIELVRGLGVERVILARELSLLEIGTIRGQTDMPLEVFVHGALCVAYSGQCLTSESLGGRSANRGQCAQACRMPYDMIVDGVPRDLGDRAYLLSPLDLAAHDLIDDLVKLGVCSLKIEGRLKTSHYVAATTQTYRAAITAAEHQQKFAIAPAAARDLAQTFSRGFSHGFLDGINHQTLVPARFPKSRGVQLGQVIDRTRRGVLVSLLAGQDQEAVKPGDGVCFDEGRPEQQELGGRVFAADFLPTAVAGRNRPIGPMRPGSEPGGLNVELQFDHETFDLSRVSVGSLVWKTDDPALRKRLESSYARDLPTVRQPVHARLAGQLGEPLTLQLSDALGRVVSVSWPGPLEAARSQPLSPEAIGEQLGRLGDTPFELAGLQLDLPSTAMTPKSVLNDLRRRAATALVELQARELRQRNIHPLALDELRRGAKQCLPATDNCVAAAELPGSAQLYVLVRSLEQLDAVLAWRGEAGIVRPTMVYCDFEDVRRYREAVERARAAELPIALATLRIIKPGEDGLLTKIAQAGADAVLIRNLAGLAFFREQASHIKRIGDYSLNIANELTADFFASQGLSRLTPSYDLSWEQMSAMLGQFDAGWFEAVVHQHMPMFHMEHCVFAAVLSDGKDHRDCGRPCDHHRVELRDRATGSAFPLLADTGCRNTVFNAVAQSAAEYISRMQKLGVRHFRVELLRETPTETASLLDRYARLLAGQEVGKSVWRQLNVLNQLGVTRGTLRD